MAHYFSLSPELEKRICEDRKNHWENPYAFRDENVIRRDMEHDKASLWRPAFVRDCEKIMHIPYYNRYADKTQVFSLYRNDDITRRLLHVQLVARIARNIGRALNLNLDLIEAISLGHDIGHTPFGHAGEAALSRCLGKPFRHNEQSLRVVDVLENEGRGLNLTNEVRLGILGHTGSYIPETLEGQVVRRSDQIAYVNHDIDDAIRAGILSNEDIPRSISDVLGCTHRDRINTLVCDTIRTSREAGAICMTPATDRALRELREFMFDRVYRNPVAKGEESKAKAMLQRLFEYYVANPNEMPEDFQPQLSFDGMERTVCDYIAGMTDNYAVYKYTEIFIPTGWQVR